MNVNELIPLIRYSKVRTPHTNEDKWRAQCGIVQEQQILSIAFRHDLGMSGQYALGCAVIHHYRDFCGGMMVESGMADITMSSQHGYTGYRILGGRTTEDVESLPHINDLVSTPPTSDSELTALLEKSVAGAIVSQAMGEGRALLHFMDKENGKLSAIMKHVNTDMLTNVPSAPLAIGTGRVQPWRPAPRQPEPEAAGVQRPAYSLDREEPQVPDSRYTALELERARLGLPIDPPMRPMVETVFEPVIPRLIESCLEFKEVTVNWMETGSFLNHNSGNDVYGAIINLDKSVSGGDDITAYCDYCDETFTYDGYTECPECSGDLFDEGVGNTTTGGRPGRAVDAIRAAFSQQGAWKFVPHSLWRCG